MKDPELQELFEGFDPELTPTADFMASLSERLDAVEVIRQHNEARLRRVRRAARFAALAGVAAGVVMTLLAPRLAPLLSALDIVASNPGLEQGLTWIAVACTTLLASAGAYRVGISAATE